MRPTHPTDSTVLNLAIHTWKQLPLLFPHPLPPPLPLHCTTDGKCPRGLSTHLGHAGVFHSMGCLAQNQATPQKSSCKLCQRFPLLAGVSSLRSATSVSFKQGAVNLSWQRQQCGKVLVLHAHSPYAAPHPSKWEGIWGQLWEILQGCDVSAFPNSFFFLL